MKTKDLQDRVFLTPISYNPLHRSNERDGVHMTRDETTERMFFLISQIIVTKLGHHQVSVDNASITKDCNGVVLMCVGRSKKGYRVTSLYDVMFDDELYALFSKVVDTSDDVVYNIDVGSLSPYLDKMYEMYEMVGL